jgi:hypothetical protein
MSETKYKFEVGQAVKFALHGDRQFEYGKTGYIYRNEALTPGLPDSAHAFAEIYPYRVVWDDGQTIDVIPEMKIVLQRAQQDTGIPFGVGWLMSEEELEAVE